ncbi:MAG: peptidylprolyl isomerase [Myxococcales bacterium]|nr:peptidylprolyl isomerase [Myxococcales bacterium]
MIAATAALATACVTPSGSEGGAVATSGADAGADAVDAGQAAPGTVQVIIETSEGTIEVSLDKENAPITTANFVGYVGDKFYDGLLFHRVIAGFMIQGGGMDKSGAQKATKSAIKNEATNGLKNLRGTIAMARTNVIDSATSQFFINLKDNAFLDHKNDKDYGYAVFGKVTAGMDVVDKIAAVKTTGKSSSPQDKPLTDILIKTIRIKGQ